MDNQTEITSEQLEEIMKRLAMTNLSRRDFLRIAGTTGGALAVAAFLNACGGSNNSAAVRPVISEPLGAEKIPTQEELIADFFPDLVKHERQDLEVETRQGNRLEVVNFSRLPIIEDGLKEAVEWIDTWVKKNAGGRFITCEINGSTTQVGVSYPRSGLNTMFILPKSGGYSEKWDTTGAKTYRVRNNNPNYGRKNLSFIREGVDKILGQDTQFLSDMERNTLALMVELWQVFLEANPKTRPNQECLAASLGLAQAARIYTMRDEDVYGNFSRWTVQEGENVYIFPPVPANRLTGIERSPKRTIFGQPSSIK